MASSFASQIPAIVHLIAQLRPATMLDVGKGFGKYGFLAHEYSGISPTRRTDSSRTLAEQSNLIIDAVECNRDYLWPHLGHIYRTVYEGRIEDLVASLPNYDLVIMCDVIEHLPKETGKEVVKTILAKSSKMIVSTPRKFFAQGELYKSPDERHISEWGPRDFRSFGVWVDWQNIDAGSVYLLSHKPHKIRGFGHDPLTRFRRVARACL